MSLENPSRLEILADKLRLADWPFSPTLTCVGLAFLVLCIVLWIRSLL